MGRTKKYTIEDMRKIAQKRGGSCISSEYDNAHIRLRWQCGEGHEWGARSSSIIRGSWCPHCAGIARLTIAEIQKLAEQKGGACLADHYANTTTKLRWKCKKGHIWEAATRVIRRGAWCPRCAVERRKGTIEQMKNLANSKGGKCLSTKYIDDKTKLLWLCAVGHTWKTTPGHIKSGKWCPTCAFDRLRGTIEEMRALAERKEGKCLSIKYASSTRKLRWKCKEGHEWGATPNAIKSGDSWCPYCSHSVRLGIEKMRDIAKNMGGKCLSTKYVNNRTKLEWQCKEGHMWKAMPFQIKDGGWCPYCSHHAKLTIEEMRQIAEARGGKCLSDEYLGAEKNLSWQCNEGHIWKATPHGVKRGKWCRKCGVRRAAERKMALIGIEKMHNIAKSRGGACLSDKYSGLQTKLKWQCKEGHIWEATPASIRNYSSWCPTCSEGISERICHKIFEAIFNERFSKRKYAWLLNSKGNRMELDGYNENLQLAFEYQGIQHYEDSRMFSLRGRLQQRKADDERKRQICKERGIVLIEVPYTVDYAAMPAHIIEKCKEKGVKIPAITKSLDYKLMEIYSPETIKEMQELAGRNGGKCLSTTYLNVSTKLKWQCKEGHIWEAPPTSIKCKGKWCPICRAKRRGRVWRYTIDDMRVIAKERGGACLSVQYLGASTKLRWKCKEGHEWMAVPGSISYGTWCPFCRGRGRTIVDMQNVAERKGGRCLSKEYVDNNTKLEWECKLGHRWKTAPYNILRAWCPICARQKKKR